MQLQTMQKQEKRRELHLKRFWRSPKTTSSEDSIGYDSPQHIKAAKAITKTTALISSAAASAAAITAATTATTTAVAVPTAGKSATTTALTTIKNDGQSRYNHLFYTRLSQNDTIKSIGGMDINVHNINTDIDINTINNTAATGGVAILSRLNKPIESKPTCSLPLLQVWPSQDSPRGEADGQSFVFPILAETSTSISSAYDENGGLSISPSTTGNTFTTSLSGISNNSNCNSTNSKNNNNTGKHLTLNTLDVHRNSIYCDTLQAGGDSGIDSVQASPSPNAFPPPPSSTVLANLRQSTIGCGGINGDVIVNSSCNVSPATTPTRSNSPNATPKSCQRMNNSRTSISIGGLSGNCRRKSSTLLHPDHARLVALRMKHSAALERSQTSPDQTSIEDATEFHDNGLATNLRICSASSSTTSSLTSVAAVSLSGIGMISQSAAGGAQQRVSDPWLQPQSDRERDSRHERRRSSTMTARYSLFDALDLEYALLRAAARGSVGPYSLSESIHKLTFTQSLAFPALARGLASKRRRSATRTSTRPLNPNESGLNTCAKVITAIILVAISFMVFFIVYKFVRT